MEINRNAPATAEGELQIAANPEMVSAGLLEVEAERRVATA